MIARRPTSGNVCAAGASPEPDLQPLAPPLSFSCSKLRTPAPASPFPASPHIAPYDCIAPSGVHCYLPSPLPSLFVSLSRGFGHVTHTPPPAPFPPPLPLFISTSPHLVQRNVQFDLAGVRGFQGGQHGDRAVVLNGHHVRPLGGGRAQSQTRHMDAWGPGEVEEVG